MSDDCSPGDRTELQAELQEQGGGPLRIYRRMAVGRPGLWAFIRYELITGLFGGLPGALGYALRRLFYPRLFGRCGRGVVFGRHIVLRHPHKIELGDRVVIDDYCVLDAKREDAARIRLADGVLLSRGTVISTAGIVDIGENCNLGLETLVHCDLEVTLGRSVLTAARCYLMGVADYRHARTDIPVVRQGKGPKLPLRLEDHVWVGAGAFVRSGVTVGRDAIIAVNSVVNRDVASCTVVAGAPARVVKNRRGQAGGDDL